jgi:hypothetical protein
VRAVFEKLAQTRPAGFAMRSSSCRTRASSYTFTPMKAPQPERCNRCRGTRADATSTTCEIPRSAKSDMRSQFVWCSSSLGFRSC